MLEGGAWSRANRRHVCSMIVIVVVVTIIVVIIICISSTISSSSSSSSSRSSSSSSSRSSSSSSFAYTVVKGKSTTMVFIGWSNNHFNNLPFKSHLKATKRYMFQTHKAFDVCACLKRRLLK